MYFGGGDLENGELNKITISNLCELSKSQNRLSELRACELDELAYELSREFSKMREDDYGIYEILSYFGEILENIGLLPNDKAELCRRLLSKLSELNINLTEGHFLSSEHSNGRMAYVKSSIADEAYDVFASGVSHARLTYVDGINEAVLSVLSGECEYCILPFEEKGGVRVSSVMEQIFRNDLKINRVTPVFGPLGNLDMKYALLSKSFTLPKSEKDDDRYLEIRLRTDASLPIFELIMAAESFDAQLYRINTVRYTDEDGDADYCILVFKSFSENYVTLLMYLTVFAGAYTPVGIYKNLE
jgi:hypothetical protein